MSEVASKIIEGHLLSREEWQEACEKGILKAGKLTTYEGFLATYYIEEKPNGRCGYICLEHPHRTIEDPDGQKWNCGWGLHLEDLDPRYLTDLNVMLITWKFGREELEKIFDKARNKSEIAKRKAKATE